MKDINMNDDFFFSVDRLVEFGLSMAVAQQMIKTMNDAMSNMTIAGVNNPINKPDKLYHVLINDIVKGPLNEQDVLKLILKKEINGETYLWHPGLLNWEKASLNSNFKNYFR